MEFAKRFGALIDKSEREWKERIEGFEAQVALKSPRAYWQSRAERHVDLARIARRNMLIVAALLLIFVFGAGVAEIHVGLPEDLTGKIVTGLTRTLLFATILAIGAWWLKQILRDVRTHDHLAEDAAERATMIETYAALKSAGLENADLKPVLSALYRPGVGILTDDTGMVLPTEILLQSVAAAARAK